MTEDNELKLTKIEVKKLFGIFDHSIPLKTEENITILIGENGLGKTVMLEAINSFFSKEFDFFYNLEFLHFRFHFDNSDIWELTKKSNNEKALFISKMSKDITNQKSKEYKIAIQTVDDEEFKKARNAHKNRLMRSQSYDGKNIDQLSLDYYEFMESHLFWENINRFNRHNTKSKINEPSWFLDGIKSINVQLIETQRILTLNKKRSDSYINNVQHCSEELKSLIELASKKASDVTLSLDSSYPNRLIRKLKHGSNESFEELNYALIKLDQRRKSLSDSGLTIDSQDTVLLDIDENQRGLIDTLKLYIDDSHQKLEPYDELSSKIILFKDIINKRFKHKTLVISQDEGMYFLSNIKKHEVNSPERIPTSKLSSGEQNELILFFKLIFNSEKGDIILIDEPELSLHISWQNNFINDLKEVTSINDVSVIIATHSPDIIDDNWDLRVELVGVE